MCVCVRVCVCVCVRVRFGYTIFASGFGRFKCGLSGFVNTPTNKAFRKQIPITKTYFICCARILISYSYLAKISFVHFFFKLLLLLLKTDIITM